MALHIVGLFIIPIILTIVSVSPFEVPVEEEEESEDLALPESDTNFSILFFALLCVWLLLILRMLYRVKRGTFKIQTKY